MANTRKSRVPKEEQLKLINECRTSGMTDIDWCRKHGIAVSTFYYWVKQLRSCPDTGTCLWSFGASPSQTRCGSH